MNRILWYPDTSLLETKASHNQLIARSRNGRSTGLSTTSPIIIKISTNPMARHAWLQLSIQRTFVPSPFDRIQWHDMNDYNCQHGEPSYQALSSTNRSIESWWIQLMRGFQLTVHRVPPWNRGRRIDSTANTEITDPWTTCSRRQRQPWN
jgi:hypothetical protein